MAVVRLAHISKRYAGAVAPSVDDVSFTVADGEFMVLLGPSGCGKSTTLRMIAGLESITGGEMSIDDRVVNDVPAMDRDIAMVFQSYALYPHMTVAENLAFGLKRRKIDKAQIDERVGKAAGILGLGELLQRKPFALSGGQRQRVALGRAMVRKPWLFLMDEPLSNLDAKLRVTMRAELKRFHLRLETTTVYVTHDQLEAMTLSDKIAVMEGGVVQQYATPEEVYNRPANLFVAGFIGSPPMNFLAGAVIDSGVVSLDCEGTRHPVAPSPFRAALSREVVLGVRPQDFAVFDSARAHSLAAEVSLVQLVGSEKLVDLNYTPNARICAQVKADTRLTAGQKVWVGFDPARLHLFDPASGRNLALDERA